MRPGPVIALVLVLGVLPGPAAAAVRYVKTTGTDNSTCTLAAPCKTIQHAVDVANAGDTISVGAGKFTESFGVAITKNLTVIGAGAFSTTVSSFWNFSVFFVDFGITVVITDVFIRHGQAENGGGIENRGTLTLERVRVWQNTAGSGGGIYNWAQGSLTVRDSDIAYNKSTGSGGGLHNQGAAALDNVRVVANKASSGAGIAAGGGSLLTVNRSLIAWNDWTAVSNFASIVVLTNTTISHNRGFGLQIRDGGLARLIHVTLADNGMAPNVAGVLVNEASTLDLVNTIIANNGTVQCDIESGLGPVIIASGSLVSDGSCPMAPPPHNWPGVDPMLRPLNLNGAFTSTHALKAGSPAIDHALTQFCEPVDQRGINRPIDGDKDGEALCDIGAYEYLPPVRLDFTVERLQQQRR